MKKTTIILSLLASVATPALANNADRFLEHDPIGWMMAIISMMVVFSALFILFICFKYGYIGTSKFVHLLFINHYKKLKTGFKHNKKGCDSNITVKDAKTGEKVDDAELAAAIAMALFLNEDGMHDKESDVLTFASANSAWTGAGMNQKPLPGRK